MRPTDLSCPATAVASLVTSEVLAVLAGTTMPLTGRQVHGLVARGSQKGVSLALGRLAATGLVNALPAGNAVLYTLNRSHVAADAVVALVGLRTRLFDRIRGHMEQWHTRPVAAAVFGSAARGDGGAESDIDLFVVRPPETATDDAAWAADVADLRARVREWSGNPCSIVEASVADVRAMIDRGAPVVRDLRRDAIDLVGSGVLSVP